MPLFEFVCEDCQSEFELLVGPREKAHCPSCESERLEKLMSSSSGRIASGAALPITNGCPPAEMGPCSPNCCRLP
ncbi:MAG: zinc ribbon domain-containing protein [Fuerstiella sp.]|jgi:putative FmdB family regulatory protein|nr:zinc ribbon domain-containing protein [Fuerstiella sp.]MCP4508146.1 zinc ribbon domain-containing protein [Fuerstiella sp.]